MKPSQQRHKPIARRRVAMGIARTHAEILAVLGTVLVALSLVFTIIGAAQAWHAADSVNFDDKTDANAIAAEISLAAKAVSFAGRALLLGNVALIIGGSMVVYALFFAEYRKRWFFWTTLLLALFTVWRPTLGTVFGVASLVALTRTRSEFFARKGILTPE